MLIGCEFKSIKSAVVFETILFFLQCSETLRSSPQDISTCDVSLNNFDLNEFFKYVTPFSRNEGASQLLITVSFCLHLILVTFCPYPFKS